MRLKAPAAHIYVIGGLRHLETMPVGATSWWCVEKTAKPGEFGVLYIKSKGMALLFRLIGLSKEQHLFCRDFGLVTGDVEILARVDTPIHASVLRAHPVLKRLPALGRSFQRKSFRLDEPFLTSLAELLGREPGAF